MNFDKKKLNFILLSFLNLIFLRNEGFSTEKSAFSQKIKDGFL